MPIPPPLEIPRLRDEDLPDVAIGILSYNRADEVLRTLEVFTTIDYPREKLHLVVIDNASVDGTRERVEERFGSTVEVMQLEKNVGSIARNHVLLERREAYVFYFDEDCAPADSYTIRRAVEIMESHPWIGAICLRSINQHSGQTEWGDYRRIARRRIGTWGYEGLNVVGAGMGFRGEAIRRTRGYDPQIFWGAEEFQLTLELLYNDVRIVYVPDLALIHRHAPRSVTRTEAAELYTRNNVLTAFTFMPLPVAAAFVVAHVGRGVAAALLKRRGAGARAILRGLRRGLSELPGRFARRRVIPLGRLAPHYRWILSTVTVTPRSEPEPRDAERVARSPRPLATGHSHEQ